ncbi:MAG: DNA translocase FtsK [Chitinophagales bacterium]
MAQKKRTTKKNSKSNNFKQLFDSQRLINKFLELIKSKRTHQLVGFSFVLLSFFLLISFCSYILSSWGTDQSYVKDISLSNVIADAQITTQNWLGRLGSFLSHTFIYKWFGLAAFIVPILVFLTGLKLLVPRARFNLLRAYQYASLSLILGASILGLLFHTDSFPFGGGLGSMISNWLIKFIGLVGAGLFLLFCLGFVLILIFDIPIDIDKFLKFDWLKMPKMPAFEQKQKTTKSKGKAKTKQQVYPTNFENNDKAEENNHNKEQEEILTYGKQTKFDLDEEEAAKNSKNAKKSKKQKKEMLFEVGEGGERDITDIEKEDTAIGNIGTDFDPTLELSKYQKPNVELLDMYGRDLYEEDVLAVSREELERNKEQIVETLSNYKIAISKITATPGPTVTLYEIIPAAGIRISRIRNLEDDIALSLAALGIRIIAPMPGKGTIGIEVPNQKKEIVSLRSLIASEKFQNTKMELPIALGKTISDGNFIADLAKMPHLLMAGATGQGKSVCLNSILVSLLYKKHPAELKIVMIDPKKVELSLYEYIEKHFLAKLPNAEEAIVTDTKKVINTLNALCIEMDMRYDLLKRAYVRNLREYNGKFRSRKLNPEKGHRFLPYIVLVIDEFADLIMTAGKEVEMPIARLAQLARAVGIHLVIATQRPTVNIITGTIKANFPVRVAFRVTSKIDSRTILDTGGANQLIGKGDMLLSIGGDIVRLQGAFVDTPEVERISEYISQQQSYPQAFLLPEYIDDDDKSIGTVGDITFDDLFEEAAHIIVQHQQGSTSLLQRRLKLGYNRAGRIIDQLEAVGVVGPHIGSKAREVYIPDAFELEKLLESLRQQKY